MKSATGMRKMRIQERTEEVGEAGLSVGGALRQRRPLCTYGRKLELFAQSADALLLQAHAALSSNDSYTDNGCCSDSNGSTLACEIAGASCVARIGSAEK